jgi:hypothetical protein
MRCRQLFVVAGLTALIGLAAAEHGATLLPAQQAGGPAGPKRCVGISALVLRYQNPVVTRVYRVFDDGSVETYDDGAPGAAWNALGR